MPLKRHGERKIGKQPDEIAAKVRKFSEPYMQLAIHRILTNSTVLGLLALLKNLAE
jgi:hypothetical protein